MKKAGLPSSWKGNGGSGILVFLTPASSRHWKRCHPGGLGHTRMRIEKKHPLAIRWFHWINFPVMLAMVWSGTLIYWANHVYRIGWGGWTLFPFFPDSFYDAAHIDHRLAEGMGWHFLFAWFFTINGILYVLYLAISKQWRYIVPKNGSLKEALQVVRYDLKLSTEHPPRRKFNGAQQFAYTGVILVGLGSLLTGLAIYKSVQFSWLATLFGGYQLARTWHFVLTIAFVLFFLVHVAQVIRAGWNNFRAMVTGYELVPADPKDPIAVKRRPAKNA